MLCQHCKKNTATHNRVFVINGETFESHLCSVCYAEMYGGLDSNAGIWAGLFGTQSPREKQCPVCGTTYADYERTGLLGCASCYDVFKEELIPSIRRIQGKVNHVGKTGKNLDEMGLYRKIKSLRDQLETAIREKRYTEADALNGRINEISKKIYKEDGDE